MCSFFGYKVVRLQRVRVINITLAGLAPGRWRTLQPEEVRGLRGPQGRSSESRPVRAGDSTG
jgi:23S rRNA pseudouridine2604 synthase